jgi:hypothetical protein
MVGLTALAGYCAAVSAAFLLPGLVNVITAAFNGINHSNRGFGYADYPSDYAADLRQVTGLVAGWGFAIGLVRKVSFPLSNSAYIPGSTSRSLKQAETELNQYNH